LESVLLKTIGQEKLKITDKLSFLAHGKENDTICYSEEKKWCEKEKKI